MGLTLEAAAVLKGRCANGEGVILPAQARLRANDDNARDHIPFLFFYNEQKTLTNVSSLTMIKPS
jgi:hypothetical protein